jgi:predicted permease
MPAHLQTSAFPAAMQALLHDLRYALRQIRLAPAFTFFVVITLAIGIGANTTIFSIVNALLLRPLPYTGADRLVQLSGSYIGRGDDWSVSLPNAVDWRKLNHSLEDIAYLRGAGYSLVTEDRPERLEAVLASANLFPLLGVQPALGRGFTPAEDAPSGERVTILSHSLWQRRFAGDPAVLGRVITLSGNPVTIIGVMPADFSFPGPGIDLWTPVRADETTWNRGNGGLMVIGRRLPDTTLPQAQADLDAVSQRLAQEYPQSNQELSAHLQSLQTALYGGSQVSRVVTTLLSAVVFVLLIACVNVANLLVARGTGREREVAVRTAIGANRPRVLRQLLTESLLLALLGGVAGTVFALWGTRALPALIPEGGNLTRDFSIDGRVLAFTLLLTLLTGIAFGLAPALRTSRADLQQLLGGRSGRTTRARVRRRNLLVAAEVALALMLLVAAGLMVRSLSDLLARNPGFRSQNLLTLRVSLDASYATKEQVLSYQQQVLEKLRAVPGVTQAGAVDWIPLGGTNNFGDFRIEGSSSEKSENAGTVIVSPGYLAAMEIPLSRGRRFEDSDVRAAPGVVLINQTMAKRYWPDQDPLGERLQVSMDNGDPQPYLRTVIGIVGDVRHSGLDDEPRAEMYVPFAQLRWVINGMTFVLRTRQDPLTIGAAAQQAIWSVDRNQPVYDVRTMERLVRESGAVMLARVLAQALALFGLVALLLAALGLYGVISYSVAQRTWEIGVRSALGAEPGRVLALVLRQGMSVVALGLCIGLAGALALTRAMQSLLYDVSASDPLAFSIAALTLTGVALFATWVPARRASRVDPVIALRME